MRVTESHSRARTLPGLACNVFRHKAQVFSLITLTSRVV